MDGPTTIIPTTENPSTYTHLAGQTLRVTRSVWLFTAILSAIFLVMHIFYQYPNAEVVPPIYTVIATILPFPVIILRLTVYFEQLLVAATFLGIAWLIFFRRSDSWVGFSVSMALMMTGLQFTATNAIWNVSPSVTIVLMVYGALASTARMNALFCFPDGHYVPRWAWLILAINTAFYLPVMTLNLQGTTIENMNLILNVSITTSALAAQLFRYRYVSDANQKRQTRWALFGLVVAMVVFLVLIIVRSRVDTTPPNMTTAIVEVFNAVVFTLILLLVPVCIAIAILRNRLLDIDLIIGRSVVYGLLTALLGAVFFVTLLVLQAIFQQSGVPVAASALVIAVLFQPMRVRLRQFVARRFYHESPATARSDKTLLPGAESGLYSGREIGPYIVKDLVGTGGMAEVYRGEHTKLARSVAIKIMNRALANEDDFRHRFEREARVVAGLRHPNIVQVYDFGDLEGVYYIAMEFLEGQDLSRYLKQQGRLSLEEAIPLLHDIASALDYAHEQGLIHRDVKPSNIVLQPTKDGTKRAVLTDFGIARIASSQTELTHTGTVGTLDYIAPEQIVSAREVTPQADIYSLGVVAYQMLTARLPFHGENPAAVILGHLQKPAPDARQVVPTIPEPTAKALMRALAKTPADRFATAGALVQQLVKG
jgi:tRNA A-37 threonylcarbamoyl transferase component Bud32